MITTRFARWTGVTVVLGFATAVLIGCLDSWDKPIGQTPQPGYPCGTLGVVCVGMNDAGSVQPTGMCCDQGTVCGGGWPNVGCPTGECCDEGTIGARRHHPKQWMVGADAAP